MSKQIPDNYFENLPSRVEAKVQDIEDDIIENAPILSKISKKGIYTVPEYYFSQLSINIITKTQRRINNYFFLKRIAIAASISLILAFGFNKFFNVEGDNLSLADLEIIDYYIDNVDELDIEMIANLDLLSETNTDSFLEEIQEGEIEEYLTNIIDEVSIDDLLLVEDL